MSKKSWGSDIIDKKNWIDPTKKYKCGGKPVENIVIKLTNSCGNEVTYPVKGSIVVRKNPLTLKYAVWSLDGLADVVWGNGHNLKLAKK